MRVARIAVDRLRSIFRSSRAEADMQRELAIHIEQLTREYVASGMSDADACRAARLDFGSLEGIKEACRDTRRVTIVQDLFKDVGYAIHLFVKSPGFTLTAVLSLGLGIGATTAIFSLVDAVLLRMLPVEKPNELVEVSREGGRTLSYPMYEVIRARNDVFSGILLTSAGRWDASLHLGAINAGDVHLAPVSGNYFAVLGVTPVLGRPIVEDDLRASNVAVISYRLWQRAFGGDPSVLGKPMRIGGRRDYTVIGVAPPRFTGVLTGLTIDLWVPITWFDRHYLLNRDALMFRLMARRKSDVSLDRVRANMPLIAGQLGAEWHLERPPRIEIADGSGGLRILRRQFSGPLWVLLTVIALLLLIATVNVANLLLARAGARRREMAVRLSLGASRWRLIRQLLTESVVLGSAGGALGLLLAPIAATSLVRFLSSAMGRIDLPIDVDTRMLGFTLATSFIVVCLFGLAPALAATRLDLTAMFKGSPCSTGAHGHARPGKLLVGAQVAISCVLLSAALLFARSLLTLTRQDAGFRPENVLLLGVGLDPGKSWSELQRVQMYERVLDRLAATPGVRSTALSSENLFSGNSWTEPVSTPRFAPQPGQDREAVLLVISPRFFETMGTRILRGRSFNPRDDDRAARVAIVNEAAARYFFGTTDAVGEAFQIGAGFSAPMHVVGVVRDAKYKSLRDPAPRIIYLPALQMPGPVGQPNLAIRTTGDPERMADLLWKEAHREVPDLRWRGVTTQARLVEGTIAPDRMLAQLSGAFGFTALVLVCLGLYGLTAYEVSRRTAEIGVRLALGARRIDVTRLIVGRSMIPAITGLVVGLAAAAALARLVESLLFGVRSSDAFTFTAAPLTLLIVAAAAAYWPARRAARLDPQAILRAE